MHYDLDVFRAILRQFAIVDRPRDIFSTDGVILTSMGDIAGSEAVPEHADRLVDVGLVRRTNDIHMKKHPDPPTLRVTDEGRIWVRRSHDGALWAENAPELQRITGESHR